ncbi:MAG: HlyD family efflux transporter periplasmic adaptor subunit [Candidatus Paceibacterota bacterium]|jgi:HlyD family secretion protein
MLQKIKLFILSHKIVSLVALLIVIICGYFLIKSNKNSEASYTTASVERSNIITYVTGTGQIEATNTLTLKSGTTGDVTYVGVKVGDFVKKGKLIASVDSRDAKIALENAKISLTKLIDDPDSLTLLQKENSVSESYNDGWNTASSFITEINSMIGDIKDVYNIGFFNYENVSKLSSVGKDKVDLLEENYYELEKNIKEITKLYKSLSRASSEEEIMNLLNKSHESAKLLANNIKEMKATFDYMVNYLDYQDDAEAISTETDLNSWLDSSNNYVTDLLSSINSINENTESLNDILEGEDKLDIRSAELSVQSKQNAYNDCFVHAPFDGIIATLTAKVGESSGSSIGTLITEQKVVTISLNEVDIAKVELGQKTILTFDAIEDLSVEGVVSEIDSVGTVSSGVVTYNVKISFDSDDERIKTGMSTNIEITTESKENILVVPSSAIKAKNGVSYVEIFNPSSDLPIRKEIEIGISDDTLTEIISGLDEGDKVIIKTTTSGNSSTSTKSSTNDKNIMMGGGSPMGGAVMGGIMR